MAKKKIYASLAALALVVGPTQASNADDSNKKSESNSLTNQIVANKWITPSSTVNVKVGSELNIKLNLTTNTTNTIAVTGVAGKKNLTTSNLLLTNNIFPGQVIEFVNPQDASVLPVGTKVVKIKGSTITVSANLTKNFSGSVKISGLGLIDNKGNVQVFAAPCVANAVSPFLISSNPATVKPSESDKSKDNDDDNNSDRGNSVLSYKWKVAKTQAIGCYNLYARYVAGPIAGATSLVISPTDFKNPASINILAKNKS